MLGWRSGVLCDTLRIETTDVCYTDRMAIVATSFAVGTLVLDGASLFYAAILEYDEVVADIFITSRPMQTAKILHRHFAPWPIRRAMDDDFFYLG